MSFRLKASRRFERRLKNFMRRHPDYHDRVNRVLHELRHDPFQPHLHLHALRGQLQGLHAVRLDYSNRIVLMLELEEGAIRLLDIGTHDEVYR
jgi:mRNA-degrading endonuclease YafQ of YafQ-DinJ toxin-antitoxin module